MAKPRRPKANGTTGTTRSRKDRKESEIDVEIAIVNKGGKKYYTLRYAGTGKTIATMWRNDKSPREYAKKHNFNII